jgi:hypothetical protein
MNRNMLSALGTLMLLSTVAEATLLPDGRLDSVIYKQEWLRTSVQTAKAEATSLNSLNVIMPLHSKVAVILPRPARG